MSGDLDIDLGPALQETRESRQNSGSLLTLLFDKGLEDRFQSLIAASQQHHI